MKGRSLCIVFVPVVAFMVGIGRWFLKQPHVSEYVIKRVPACGKLSTIYQDLILILQSAKILKYFQNFPKYQNTFFNLK